MSQEFLLYIVRHAWAEERNSERYPEDALRPLTAAGRKRFARMVKTLRRRDVAPTLIVSSPLVRCRETAELLCAHLRGKPRMELRDELAPGGSSIDLMPWTLNQEQAAVAWVGHSPDVEQMTAAWIGGPAHLRFPKGAVAAIRFGSQVAPGYGQLLWLVTAKMLGC